MKLALAALAILLTLIHAFPSTTPTTALSVYEKRLLTHSKRGKDKDACIKVTMGDGTVWDRFCKPAHECVKITKPEEAPLGFNMPASTVCTLFRGGPGKNAWCNGTPRDFEGSDRDLWPLPVWNVQNSKGWACYDRT
ncbi:hypothetical protein Vi05172_g12590 [Venturia inaequalis]|uniref:Uncharacterized protein n=1 Tax=Venturia inaequalis TaxID=5025 RepID=A0A8H3ZEC9_VENIN|nr:hypothetical protein EG327_001722 [Venturia inaequalis]RDI77380.1 hypothetical protein Vi05172_g12590 [Venturia inaequalis]